MSAGRELFDGMPPELRALCVNAWEEGRARALGVELVADDGPRRAPQQARPAASPIPIHPETPPRWFLEERRLAAQGRKPPANRRERRALDVARSVADGRTAELERELYREKMRAHQRAHVKRWRYIPSRPALDGHAPTRPMTAQQVIASRSALADEWGARAAVSAMPAPIAAALVGWIDSLPLSSRYGSPWSSRLVRRTVATLCAILYACRPSWREGYAVVTIGMGRERLAGIMGCAPESGREYSLSALSHVELGSLAILERLGVMARTQLPGDAVPGCDRGTTGFAFNHYLFPAYMVRSGDEWGDPSRPNPSLPRELREHVAPWLALGEKARARVELARAAALAQAIARHEGVDGEPVVVELVDQVDQVDQLAPPERPPPLR